MNQLFVTFEETDDSSDGVQVDNLVTALEGIQDAVRLLVQHLGDRQPRPGQPPRWVRDQSTLRLSSTHAGSFITELTIAPPPDGQQYLENYGEQAIEALISWDGEEDSTLPRPVTDRVYGIKSSLGSDVRLWLGGPDDRKKTEIKDRGEAPTQISANEPALLYGWLREVNWDRHTAQLHRSAGDYIPLRFDPRFDGDMLSLATTFVEVSGQGRLNQHGNWTSVQVQRVSPTGSKLEPFELEQFLDDPNPKAFNPEEIVHLDLNDEEFEEFLRAIREGRDA